MNVVEHFIVEREYVNSKFLRGLYIDQTTVVYDKLGLSNFRFGDDWSLRIGATDYNLINGRDSVNCELYLNDLTRFSFHDYMYVKSIHDRKLTKPERHLLSICALYIIECAERFSL